jgi:hypothetical protein
MTGAERQQRYRWNKAILKKWCDRWKSKAQVNWLRDGEPELIANMLAHIHFDMATSTANYERWNAINEAVLDTLAQLERDHPIP